MDKHLTFIAVIHIVFGIMGFIFGLGLFFLITGGGLLSREPIAIFVTSAVGSALAIFLTVLSVPGIIAGIGLLKRKSWARIFMLIISVLDLMNIPFGTVLGVYTIWALMQDESVVLCSA